jgi:tRNA(adenine34) deaminase
MINKLIKLNKKALKNGDVPVSCLILKDNKVISTGYNMKVKKNDPFAHAEIIAIKKASKKLKTFNLGDCEMIVTLKPCSMCEAVILESRLKTVSYILDKEKEINNNIQYNQIFIDNSDYFRDELQSFFKSKR